MSSLDIASIVFACVFGSAMLSLLFSAYLPAHHLSTETKDVVKLGTGLIGTLAALVLGLLVSSAKGSFDRFNEELMQQAAKFVLLDRTLAQYGPETKDLRDQLKRNAVASVDLLFSNDKAQLAKLDTPEALARSESLGAKLRELSPQNDSQRRLQARALEIAGELSAMRWLLFVQKEGALSMPFLIVLVFWLTVLFASFGLFAPRNATVIAVLLVCALSVSGAILLILELNSPFLGLIRIPSSPVYSALAHLGQ